MRLSVLDSPPGVRWAVQIGRAELLPPTTSVQGRVEFDIPLEIVPSSSGGARLRGGAVQGPAGGRFLYVNSGTRAGEVGSRWDRRAKVSLESIAVTRLQLLPRSAEPILEGEISGIAKDGGPACASVPLLRGAWALVKGTD
jgi:hypothetical protein